MSVAPFPAAFGAEFSADRKYRYLLWRVWDPTRPPLGVLMLNPSTADESRDDPTTVRNIHRARTHGYGGVVQANLYAWRATDPAALALAFDAIGPDNDRWLDELAERCPDVLLAWGNHAPFARARQVLARLRAQPRPPRLLHIGITVIGAPRHPLHTAYAAPMQQWQQRWEGA